MFEPIPITNYNYSLPDNKIAKFPLEKRDETKLLVMCDGSITDTGFNKLSDFVPSTSFLVFNNTRVIKARLVFHKSEGARIEIFCLNEEDAGEGYAIWKCYIGNAEKWKNNDLYLEDPNSTIILSASKENVEGNTYIVKFKWNSVMSFEEVLEIFGNVPLPPYLNREPVADDRERYQTIYARHDGSVAAPTAGLHFTDQVFEDLQKKECSFNYLTLHVGAGTFKPVTANNALDHSMHEEKVILNRDMLLRLIQNFQNTIISVGTTSMRSLESIYWLGLQIIQGVHNTQPPSAAFNIDQWYPYQAKGNLSSIEALSAVYDYMKLHNLKEMSGYTRIMIIPGYKFRICDALITNFHQPQSTLLLLVAAFTGSNWRKAYDHALANEYRFLSYGDSCLFFNQYKHDC